MFLVRSRQTKTLPFPFTIANIQAGSPAEMNGSFRVGDYVHAVDGHSIEHLQLNQVGF